MLVTADSKSEGHEATVSQKAVVRGAQSKKGAPCECHPFRSERPALAVWGHQEKQSWEKTYMSLITT